MPLDDRQISNQKSHTRRGALLACAVVVGVVVAAGLALLLGLQTVLRDRAIEDAQLILSRAEITVESWLDRYRALPGLYAEDPRVIEAMEAGAQSGEHDALSADLAAMNATAGTLDTYVMAPDGTTVAASNSQDAISFVGENFSYRPYFTDAMDGRTGQFFGLGTTSGLRGYYFSAPIREDGAILGVVVVKIAATDVEAALYDAAHPLFVTDATGIVALSGVPTLTLTALGPLDAGARETIERTRRYELGAIEPAPVTAAGSWGEGLPLVEITPSQGRGTFLHLDTVLPRANWTLHLLYDASGVQRQLFAAAITLAALGLALAAVTALVWQRRRLLAQRLADRERDRIELEHNVSARTRELTAANTLLEREVEQRRAVETSLRQTQSELVQAGKLAALGQMSAGLSHEFNQPLTAIRTYAENASAFYDAGRSEQAKDNLARVLRLTERMAQLSKQLTRFARRSGEDIAPVSLDAVVAEALSLLAARIERSQTRVSRTGEDNVVVMGGAIRLQHVMMNLIGNAIDAAGENGPPEIEIAIETAGERVEIGVSDNGPGIDADILPKVFDPFFTTKDAGKGLGLGLSISYNIVHDFGGTMHAQSREDGQGARFRIVLSRAPTDSRVAAQ